MIRLCCPANQVIHSFNNMLVASKNSNTKCGEPHRHSVWKTFSFTNLKLMSCLVSTICFRIQLEASWTSFLLNGTTLSLVTGAALQLAIGAATACLYTDCNTIADYLVQLANMLRLRRVWNAAIIV